MFVVSTYGQSYINTLLVYLILSHLNMICASRAGPRGRQARPALRETDMEGQQIKVLSSYNILRIFF